MGGPIPKWPASLEKRFITNCATGDPVCDVSGANILAHLTYGSGDFMKKSAQFVEKQMGI
jgi:hypothetical protein